MDIRQLTYFLEVANQSSFSKAAQQLHLSQPSLSKMVKNLENELGVVLFDRSTRHIHLTDAGEVIQTQARIILQSMEHLNTALADVTEMRKGKFRLGLPPVIGVSFFPDILARFHQLYPQIEIQLVEEGGKVIEQRLLEGEIDLGVVVLPVDEEMFEVKPIIERKMMLTMHPEHPLAAREEVALQELADESFILFRKGFALRDRVREACIREGFEPKVSYESAQWDFISEMVAAGIGISLLPETVCGKLDPRQIAVIRKTRPQIHWNLGLIWRKDGYLSHAARGWVNFVLHYFEHHVTVS